MTKRVSIPDSSVFYVSIGVRWVDVDDQKNSIVKPDFSVVDGFDAVKYNDLYLRALYRPSTQDKQEKIILGICVLLIFLVIGVGFFVYKSGVDTNAVINNLASQINTLKEALQQTAEQGAVVGTG